MEEQVQIQPQSSAVKSCPICQSANLRDVLELRQIPVLSNVLWDSREAALSAPRGDVQLTFCETCGHVFNQAFDPQKMAYDLQYENSLHFSPRFQEYAIWQAHHLVDTYDLRGKTIVEIGSGKGDFLRLLCDYGGNVGTGFDPSYEPGSADNHPSMSFVRDLYSEKYASHQADLILSRHVLEHIYQPAEFVQSLRRTIGSRKRTIVFMEVPNLGYILQDTAVWDIIYEHYSYYSANSLAYLFTHYGFNVLNLADAFGRQFLYMEAIPRDGDRPVPNAPAAMPINALSNKVSGFADRCQEKMETWRKQMDALRSARKRAVVWGAGSKGISFLNLMDSAGVVDYVIDINPRKRGKYITGAGQQIVPPEFLKEYRPDTVIIMNPIYKQEIQNAVAELGLTVDYLFAG